MEFVVNFMWKINKEILVSECSLNQKPGKFEEQFQIWHTAVTLVMKETVFNFGD